MPEFNVREVRLPELHLPEIKRDEIVRSLSGAHLPDAALAKVRPFAIRMPPVSVSSADLGRLLAAAAAIARFARPAPARRRWLSGVAGRRTRLPEIWFGRPRARRSRRPIVVVMLLVTVVGGFLFLRRPAVRLQVDRAAQRARQKVAELRGVPGSADQESLVSSAAGVDDHAREERSAVN